MKLLIIMLFILLFSSCLCHEQAKWYRDNLTQLDYKGVIVRKFLDPNKRYQPSYTLEDSETFEFNNEEAYKKAQPGDTIIKTEGTLKCTLKSKHSIFTFYPKCGDNEIKD